MRIGTADMARVLPVAVATLMLVAACAATPIKGEIRDDGITLATDHAGSSVRFDLHNVGTTPCDLVVGLTSLPVAALPVKDGHVVIDESGAPGTVRPITTYESAPTFTLGRVEAGAGSCPRIQECCTPTRLAPAQRPNSYRVQTLGRER